MNDAISPKDQLVAEIATLRQRVAALEVANTRRRQAQASLRQRARRDRHLIEHSLGLLCIHDLQGVLLEVNRAAARVLGYHPRDGIGKSLREFIAPAVRHQFDAYLERIRQQPTDSGLLRVVTRTGEERVWLYRNRRYDEHGRPSYVLGHALDITERVQAEQALQQLHETLERRVAERTAALQESEERFRNTFDNAAVGIAHVAPDGRWLRVNDRLCKITGYSHEELLTRTFQDITHPDDLEADLASVRQVLAGEIATYAMEKRYIRKHGGLIWVNLTVSLVRKPSGEPDYFISIIEDITRRKQAEEALREREERYELIVEGAEAAIWDWHVPGQRVVFSPRWKQLRGLSEAEVSDREEEWSSRIHPDDVARVMDAVRAHFEGQTPVFAEEYRVRHKDGRWIWILDRGIARRNAAGQVIRMAGSETDITVRRAAEEALRESEARFRLLADAAPVLIWVNGPDGCEFVNRPYLEFLGASSEAEVRGDAWVPFIHSDDREAYVGGYQAALAARVLFAAQFRFRRADGVYRWLQSVGTPRLLPDGTFLGYVGCSFDITAMREAETVLEQRVAERTTALEQAHDDLRREIVERQRMHEALFQQEKLAALGTLLANVAHELNNPLAVAAMQLDNLQEEASAGAWPEDIQVLRQAIERCKSVVQSFLALARQQPPSRSAVSLNAVIGDVLVLLGHALEVDGITVERHLHPQGPSVWGDVHQLQHVVSNLLTNAHHALRETPAPRHLRLATAASADGSQVLLEVTDSGPGIPAEVQPRLFEPFFTTKPQGQGSGLGLPLCRSIVEGHEGTIHLSSQPGHGTTVRVTLPAVVPEVQGPAMALESAESAPRRRGTILLIDDEPGVQWALQRLLQRGGHDVTTAANGLEGLAALEARSYEVILCDMHMPDMDGPGVYRELQRRYPHLLSRVIFLTGDVLSPEAQAFFARVDRPRLVKPFQAREVRRLIQQVLEAK